MKTIIAECTVDGHLRYGHYELELSDEKYEEFKSISEEEQEKMIRKKGHLEVDDYEVYDTYIESINLPD